MLCSFCHLANGQLQYYYYRAICRKEVANSTGENLMKSTT